MLVATLCWSASPLLAGTQPTAEQLEDLRFAWRCVKHVKSNAITVAKDRRLLGMGSGQPNRVKSVEIALEKAGADVKACSSSAVMSKGAVAWHVSVWCVSCELFISNALRLWLSGWQTSSGTNT